MTLLEAARGAARRLRDASPGATVQLVAHQSADGLAAASVLARCLSRLARPFHVRFAQSHELSVEPELDPDPARILILLALGTDLAPRLGSQGGTTILIHHEATDPTPDAPGLLVLAPLSARERGPGASAATTALALAVALSEENWDLAGVALAGAWAEGQHRGGWTGWNASALEEATRRGHVEEPTGLALDDLPLLEALAFPPAWLAGAWAPGYEGAATLLREHGLPADVAVHELDGEARAAFASALALAWLGSGRPATDLARLFQSVPRARVAPALPLPRIASLLEAAACEDEPGLGLAWMLGEASVRSDLDLAEGRFRSRMRKQLRRLSEEPASGSVLAAFRVDAPAHAGAMARLAADHALGPGRVAVAHALAGTAVRFSARCPTSGSPVHDLAGALVPAARSVGGRAGGHAAAAGGVVPARLFDQFLAEAARRLAQKLPEATA